ncbi:MucR family transcriptional regulator [Microvirga sp. SRT01]|uniref:MucR family transcriptional regulator n=1 Tax=Sphingomonas longa TaxID=2778730 RepID=A0ABS2D875_9SPHN|nr:MULTISPECIES: MucR family transcriptional regulator [Alphaproteobacteria]MBM6577137.1 MucR family transcriptional regulator [Sphingomonas sp. BT552]MBR7710181.1 MucR family transcriptional regulator [Microvirga sp. SRT01]
MTTETDNVALATELTIAWLSNPNTRTNPDDVPAFIAKMHSALGQLGNASAEPTAEAPQEYTAAVTARKSLSSRDHIISMIDGRPYKTLRRHLNGHGLTPEQYRERYNLKADYPMVAEAYSEARRDMAKKIGLGRKPGQTVAKKVQDDAKPARKSGKAALDAAKQSLGTAE